MTKFKIDFTGSIEIEAEDDMEAIAILSIGMEDIGSNLSISTPNVKEL